MCGYALLHRFNFTNLKVIYLANTLTGTLFQWRREIRFR